jgi:hypothetical protein
VTAPERNGILKHLWGGILAILLAVAVQTGGAVFWAGTMAARMDSAEQRLNRIECRVYGPLARSNEPQ